MRSIPARDADPRRRRGRLSRELRESLRDLSSQLFLLNHMVSGHVDLKAVDLQCLDLVARQGPLSPSALARRAGLHPATLPGTLARFGRGGWVVRGGDPPDRRAVVISAVGDRLPEVLRL